MDRRRPHAKARLALSLPRDFFGLDRKPRTGRALMVALYGALTLLALRALADAAHTPGDFQHYLEAGRATLWGEPIYSVPENTWPPFFSVFAAALTLFAEVSAPATRVLWQALSMGALFATVRLLMRRLHAERLTVFPSVSGGLAFLSAACLVPVLFTARFIEATLDYVQINLFVLFLAWAAYEAAAENRHAMGGALLALAASIKAVPLLLLLYFVYRRGWAMVAWTVVWLLLLNGVVVAVAFGPREAAAWSQEWWRSAWSGGAFQSAHHFNQSLYAALKRLLTEERTLLGRSNPVAVNLAAWPEPWIRAALATLGGVGLALLAWAFRRPLPLRDPRAAGEYAILLAFAAVMSPIAWKHHFVALLPLNAFAFSALRALPDGARAKSALWVAWWSTLGLHTLTSPVFVGNRASDLFEVASAVTLGALTLIALGTILLARLPRDPHGAALPLPRAAGEATAPGVAAGPRSA